MRHEMLGETGRALWDDLTKDLVLGPAQLALLLEACRIADRLDKLEARLSGDDEEWLRVEPDYENPDQPVVVIVDKALAESRQQALALKGLLSEIRQAAKSSASNTPAVPVTPAQGASAGGGNVLSLAAGIAARRSNPATG
jgi:hypothetical protein